MKYLFLLLSFFIVFTGCGKDEDEKDKIITLTIASEKRMGYAGWTGSLAPYYLTKNMEDDKWRFFCIYIEGFDYEEGYEYVVEIKVHEEPVDPTLADQELISYSLHKIISKEKKKSENLPEDLDALTIYYN